MKPLLAFAHGVDWVTDRFGTFAKWAVMASCLISAGNAVVRYVFDYSTNSLLEIQWHLFAACVMLGASQVLRVNEHVRVDVLYGRYPPRVQVLIDLCGFIVFLLPGMALMLYFSWPMFVARYVSREMSQNVGGLMLWPATFMLPLGFGLLILQGIAEVIKRIAWLGGKYDMDTHYERPLQ